MSKFDFLLGFFLAFLIFVSKGLAEEEDYNDDEPEDGQEEVDVAIISQPLVLTLKPGATAYLPCQTDRPDREVILQWRKGSNTALFFDEMKQYPEERYERLPNHTLKISRVSEMDQDVFSCQILASKSIVEHRIFVESPAEIVRVLPNVINGSIYNRTKGTPLTLACEAKGHPPPTVTWIHKSKEGKTKTSGHTVQINQLSIEHAGEYTCKAVNPNGPPSKFSFRMEVQSAPEIKTPKDIVNSAERYESELVCTVQAYPKAKVVWLREGQEIIGGPPYTYHISNNDHDYILRIVPTKHTDFGDYVCKAENDLGTAEKTISLSGIPSKPVIKLADKASDMSPVLEWQFESRARITQYEVNYKRQENSEWISVEQVVDDDPSITDSVRYTFQGLFPGTYHARLRVKNSYGWSPSSDIHSFPGVNRPAKGENPREEHLLESHSKYNGASQLRISVLFILSLVCSRLLH